MSLFSFPSFLSPKLSEFTDDELAVMGLVRGWPGAINRAQTSGKVPVEAYAQWGEFWASAINFVLA